MNLRTTAVLCVIAALLGAYVYFVEVRADREKAEEEKIAKRILDLSADSVRAIEVPLEGGPGTARLERDGTDSDRWQLTEPIDVPADPGVVSGILSSLSELESAGVIEDPPEDLSAFGLAGDSPTVTVFTDDEESRAVRLGSKTPVGAARYLSLEGDGRLFTVEEWRTTNLRPKLESLRDRRVTDWKANSVTGLRVIEHGSLLVAARRSDTPAGEGEKPGWEITEPIQEAGDATRIVRLLEDLHFLRASEFVDQAGDPAEYGLDRPEIVLELEAGEQRERVELGRKDEKVYLKTRSRPVIFQLPERALTNIPRDLFAYRHKEVLSFDKDAARRLELSFPRDDVTYAFVREDERWEPEDETVRVDSLQIEDLLFAIRGLTAEGLEERSLDVGEIGLDPPGVRVTVKDSDGNELAWVELGNPDVEQGMPARSSQTDRLWRVSNDLGEDVPLTLEAFRNNLLENPPDEEEEPVKEGEAG
jgi:hypothetical protein